MKKLLLLAIIFVGSFLSGYAQCTQIQVTATSPSPISLCEGIAQNLTCNVTISSASVNGGYTYSWIKNSAGSSVVLVAPTPLNIPVSVNTNINYTGISGALTDAGTYVLHVEDGNSGTGCYTEASVVVAVNPKPVITSAAASDACSGVAQNYEITSDIPANYTWLRGSYSTNISAQESAGFTNAITETFDNIEIVSFKIYYNITATSTTGGCKSKPFNYIVTLFPKVNPTVIISTDQAGLCEGGNITLSASPTNGKSYQWKKNNINIIGATNQTFATSTTSISENFSVEMISAEMCATTTAFSSNILTTLSLPTITSPGTANICEGIAQNYLITSDIPSTYIWTRAAVAGIGNAPRRSTSSLITEALINTTSLTLVVRYNITPTSLGGCIGETFNYDVTVNPKPYIISAATGTICSGTAQNYQITSNIPATFNWTRAAITGIANAAAAGTTNPITETLTNTTTAAIVVRYVITPTSVTGSCVGVPFNYDVTVIPINYIPTISITADKQISCINSPVNFYVSWSQVNSGMAYEWFINNVSQGTPSIYNSSFTSSSLTSTDIVYAKMNTTALCGSSVTEVTSNNLSIAIHPPITAGTIGSDQTICYGTIPAAITELTAPTNVSNNLNYFWEGSTDEKTWTYIPETASSHIFTQPLTEDLYIRRRVTDQSFSGLCAMATSNAIHIKITPINISAGTIGSDQTICSGTTPNALTELTASDAASPSYTWEQSVDPIFSVWSAATGNTSGSDFSTQGTYTSDIYFRRTVTDASASAACNTATSNIVHITVLSPLAAGTISNNETICVGTIPSTITETVHTTGGTGIYTYHWESSLQSGGPYTDIANETNSSYSPDVLNHTMYFRRIETSGSCGTVYSNEVAKTVALTILPTITIDDPGATCNGDIVLLKCKATNVGSAPIYNWYVNGAIIAVVSNSFTTDNLFKPLKNGDEVWVELISNSSCANGSTVISNKVIVDLVPCTVSNSVYTTNNVEVLLQQYVSQSIPNSIDYTYLWSITDGFISTNVINGSNQISPGQQNVVYNVPFQSGITYAWTVTGGTITNGQGTNAITVDWDNVTGIAMARTTAPSYSVSVTETNQANVSKTTTMDLNMTTTAITTSLAQSGIQFYPNPSTDAFNIVMPQSGTLVHYSITDLSGMSVASGTFTSTGGAEKITTNFNTGLYQVVLTYNETVTCLRLNKVQ